MGKSEEDFREELRKIFATEAAERLQTITAGLVEIEKKADPSSQQVITETIYRAAHSLKGAARSVDFPGIVTVCQSIEDVFAAIKKGTLSLTAADFDVLHKAADCLAAALSTQTGEAPAGAMVLIAELDRIASTKAPGAPAVLPPIKVEPMPVQPKPLLAEPPSGSPAADTIRISTDKLDAILLRAEEMISIKLASEQRILELAEILTTLGLWKKNREKSSPKIPAERNDGSNDYAEISRWSEIESRLSALLCAIQADRRATGMLIDQLLDGSKTILMQPFSILLRIFPRMIRDISREQNKEVDLISRGEGIEIDKRILEQMKDPLTHLLRNCIDHGIEDPATRRARHKPVGGTITVNISQSAGKIQILVSDDGCGIDAGKLREAAVKRGILSQEAADELDEQSARMLIFRSGMSTSSIITDLSGRGLGMAIVQEAVDKMGGSISLETSKNEGTTFRISLPLTLATFRGMLLRECGNLFVIPTANVERVMRVRTEDIRTVESRTTVPVNGIPLALERLGAVLGLQPDDEARSLLSVVILNTGHQRMAFAVESLLQEQEILIKSLGKQLVRVRNISGATVLGSGQVVPVLNVADLIKSAIKGSRTGPVYQPAKTETRRASILVTEDSITSRMLIKNILSSAGFDVKTAVDGEEAWTALKESSFDLVVSDIEMPRLNGFDLTARIRADETLGELPVVLVTSLESRADRERGVDVGANAYIVKSSFDQSNLLEVIRRLL